MAPVGCRPDPLGGAKTDATVTRVWRLECGSALESPAVWEFSDFCLTHMDFRFAHLFTSVFDITGQLPSVTHLDEVQKCLSRIQQILVQLQKFWERVGSLLDTVKKRTLAGDVWIQDLTDMKEEFLKSISAAEEGWTTFGISCMKANDIFSVQTNDAYRFLEISPSSLSEEERQKEYERVKEKLQKIRPNTGNPAAITL
ncbi:hypothetical protein DPX16_7173 [Anabarilius grahami]|uniref:Uncharacterized protein n=1 Tax=Anabarilius grahami TaxID=495550 RepID=A0A3N0XKN6_ANAGA|nr:hypothetical protein DPX16_7173 [Anabarilius grahami]